MTLVTTMSEECSSSPSSGLLSNSSSAVAIAVPSLCCFRLLARWPRKMDATPIVANFTRNGKDLTIT